MTDDSELAALIEIERAGLAVMFRLMAASRLVEAVETGDQRYNAAARSIKKIAKTMDMIDDGTLAKLSSVNQSSDGLASQLITAHLTEVGFALPAYENALGFFQPISDEADRILRNAPAKMN
jgi:hypothetical protein